MSTFLINPQKPRALGQDIPFLKNNQNLEAELEQLLAEGDPSKIALFLEKHPGFLLQHANERIHRRLQAIYAGPPATDQLQPAQTRLLQDIEYLYRLDRQLLNLPLSDIYESRREITGDINSLVPKKNERLRLEARNRILRRLIHRHLNEQCQWLKSKEQQISQGLDKALNALFYEGFQIEQENPRYLEDAIRYTLPVLEQLGPYLQQVSDLSHHAVLLAGRVGRTNPVPAKQINAQGRTAPLISNAGITSTLDIYSTVYEKLLERPAQQIIHKEIKHEKRREAAELSYLPYHPTLHAGNQ